MADQGKKAPRGFVVCRCKHPLELAPSVIALPWSAL